MNVALKPLPLTFWRLKVTFVFVSESLRSPVNVYSVDFIKFLKPRFSEMFHIVDS